MNEKTGRTLWDVISENPKLFMFFCLLCLMATGYVIHNFKVIFPSGFSIERQAEPSNIHQKPETLVLSDSLNPSKPRNSEPKPPELHNPMHHGATFSGAENNNQKISSNKTIAPDISKSDNKTNEIGIIMRIVELGTEKPIEGVLIRLDNSIETILSDKNGLFTINREVIRRYGEYSSVRATFSRTNYQSTILSIPLSESITIKLKKENEKN